MPNPTPPAERDVFNDPKPGDIVAGVKYTGFPAPPTLTVLLVLPPLIAFQVKGDVEWDTLKNWTYQKRDREVVHVAAH